MTYDPARHHRRSIRLRGYDYSRAGAYFVTVCTEDRACLFGEVVFGEMVLTDAGQVVQNTWDGLESHYPGVVCDTFIVMPNHIHGIIVLSDGGPDADRKPVPATLHDNRALDRPRLSEIVRAFKSFSARRINVSRQSRGAPVWQRNYYERIIRNDDMYCAIRKYIMDNPARWELDQNNALKTNSKQRA